MKNNIFDRNLLALIRSMLKNKKSGVSLLISLGIIFVMVFFALLVSNVVVSSIRQSSNVSRSNEAYYLAEGALEHGLLKNFEHGVGYTTDTFENVDNNHDSSYKIVGTVPEDKKYGDASEYYELYGVPTAGTGNAGSYCDTVNPFLDEKFNFEIDGTTGITTYSTDEGEFDPADHPCNWNKISTGQTVTIPLYKDDEEDEDDDGTVNLFGNDQNEKLIVRLRTPCAYGDDTGFPPEMCEPNDRFELQDNEETKPKDDPILTWQIYGFNEEGKPVTLEPVVMYRDEEINNPYHIATETHINDVINYRYVIFDQYSLGKDLSGKEGCLWHFLGGNTLVNDKYCKWSPPLYGNNSWGTNHKLTKPILKLSVIGNLVEREEGNSIPYLEYQIITSNNLKTISPVNTAQIITGEGISGTFKHILKVSRPHLTGLPDYVVQQ